MLQSCYTSLTYHPRNPPNSTLLPNFCEFSKISTGMRVFAQLQIVFINKNYILSFICPIFIYI